MATPARGPLRMEHDREAQPISYARALLNILEDLSLDKGHLQDMTRAILNILEDLSVDKQQLAHRSAELEAANKELEAFAYSVSHDLRSPLRGIDGWSQALLEDYGGRLDQQGQGYLDRIRSETPRMGRLIDGLLQLSRVTRAEMQRQPVDLSALAQRIAARLAEANPGRQIEFMIQQALTVLADPRLLEVALTNLLDNAVKFTSHEPVARIEIRQTADRGQQSFVVRDNGVGFDMTYAGSLFGAFQRLHKVTEFPGTGIGLATVQRVIRRHGGHVWAMSQVGDGASFYFTLV